MSHLHLNKTRQYPMQPLFWIPTIACLVADISSCSKFSSWMSDEIIGWYFSRMKTWRILWQELWQGSWHCVLNIIDEWLFVIPFVQFFFSRVQFAMVTIIFILFYFIFQCGKLSEIEVSILALQIFWELAHISRDIAIHCCTWKIKCSWHQRHMPIVNKCPLLSFLLDSGNEFDFCNEKSVRM